jgi:hypothetical protein
VKNEINNHSKSNLPKQSDIDFVKLLAQIPSGYELVIPRKESPYFRKKFRFEKQLEQDVTNKE